MYPQYKLVMQGPVNQAYLHIAQNVRLEDSSLQLFMNVCKPIQMINLQFATPGVISKMKNYIGKIEDFQSLASVRISINSIQEADLLINLLKSNNSKSLAELDLSGSSQLDINENEIAKQLISNQKLFANLQKFNFARCSNNFVKFLVIFMTSDLFNQVRDIDLSETQFDNKCLDIFLEQEGRQNIQRLSLKNCAKINSDGIQKLSEHLADLKSVQSLDLGGLLQG